MKKLIFFFLLFPVIAFAQKTINHTVAAKESFSSIGRLYNINGRTLAEFNKIDYDGGLSIGQVIKIPVSANTNGTSQPATSAPVTATANASGSPMYHTVTKKETLYHVSTLFPSATLENLRKWNKLTSDNIQEGAVLIVGYGNNKTKVTNTNTVTTVDDGNTTTLISDNEETVVEPAPVSEPEPVVPKAKPAKTETTSAPKKANQNKNTSGDGSGYFRSGYESTGETSRGTVGVFKSSSGWEDGKYYALFDGARQGTVLKISNKTTNKTVYVKVLDIIPTLPENKAVLIRISNAASEALGEGEDDFTAEIEW